ncbi:MAG: site-2 protease family protein [Anaerolineales bacterium]
MIFGGDIASIVSVFGTLIIAISVHEFAHAVTADALGDPTPRQQGRITLNPLKHLDLLGSMLFLIAGFGWGKPVMTNPRNYRTSVRAGMATVAVAGPLSNLALALLMAVPVRFGFLSDGFLGTFALRFIVLNVLLLVFNMIPIAPLDGFKVALGVLPDNMAATFSRLESIGPLLLLLLLVSGRFGFNVLGAIISPSINFATRVLIGA